MADAVNVTRELLAASAMKILMEDPRFTVGEAEVRGSTYRVFENAPKTIGAMCAAAAAEHGDREFLIFEDERMSYAETWAHACRLAHALRKELNVRKGDRVAIAMRNYPEWCVSYLAIVSLGAVVVPLNAWWKSEELKYAIEDAAAKIIIADRKRLDYIHPFKEEMGLTLVLAREESSDADYRLGELIANEQNDQLPDADIDPDDDFCILYTSGSTGMPKGVLLTHLGCISGVLSFAFVMEAIKDARGGVSIFGENPGVLLAVPLFHVTGSHAIFLLSLVAGRRVAMLYKWDARDAVDVINREQLTNFVGVPSQSFELIEAAGEGGMPSLIDIGSGGAKRPVEHVKKLAEAFKHANPSSGYGLSETNAVGCIIALNDYQKRPDSTGRVLPPLTDLKIVMENGEEAPRGEVGEVWIRGICNFRGYLNKPEETKSALTSDGWFRTGDLAKMDEEDYVYIVDRIKDLIIRGGENISCLEVENEVYKFPAVAEATVFSVPDKVMGERVGVAVYPKKGETCDAEELREFLTNHLAGFKVPERIWISPRPLPRLGTAKVDKITVRTVALQAPPSFAI